MSGLHPNRPVTSLCLLAAAAMPIIFFGTQIAAAPFYPGYTFSMQSVSMLGTQFSHIRGSSMLEKCLLDLLRSLVRWVSNGLWKQNHSSGRLRLEMQRTQSIDYILAFRATKPATGTKGPLIPGDPEREAEQLWREKGVPLIVPVVEDLLDISAKTGIPFG
jgi:hypothetical protein